MKVEQKPTPVKWKRAFYDGDLKKMEDAKNLGEQVKRHGKHKPYQCDFGGGKNEDK